MDVIFTRSSFVNKLSFLLVVFTLFAVASYGQVFSDKIVGKKNQATADSLKASTYPYVLPIWGKKVTELGFDIPYSAGLGINYLWQESNVLISDLQVGFNNSRFFNLDDIVRFNNAKATTNGLNIRPDIWLLPFLNIYGIFARSETSTQVDFGVWLPNDLGTEEVFSYSTTANFEATSTGFGITPTIGVGGGWLALDMNFTWTDIPELTKPSKSFVFGPRLGKSFKLSKPEQNIAIWAGGFRVKFNSETSGAIALNEVLPAGNLNEKINAGFTSIDQKQMELDSWWSTLSPAQQKLNQIKYDAANSALEKANYLLDALSDASTTVKNSTVKYDLNKRLQDMWNFIVGSQFQLNKHWMVRAEVGFLGSRTQIITGLQYRFGL